MIRNLSLAALFLAACSVLAPSEAEAQWGWQGYPQFYGRNVYTVYDQDRLPYFALHPPVYYSRAVPRTFGYSPFAYPGWVPTPALPTNMPEMIVNPYIEQQLPDSDGVSEPASPNTATPGANPPSAKGAPLQGFKPPRLKSKGSLGAGSKPDQSAAVDAPPPAPVPLRVLNPHVGPRVLTTSAAKIVD